MGGKVSKKGSSSPAKSDSKRNSKIQSTKTISATVTTSTPLKSNATSMPTSEATTQKNTPASVKLEPPSNKPTATDQTSSTTTSVNDASISKEREDIGDELVKEMNRKVTKEDFDLVVVLGVGSFGKVMKVKSKIDGKDYAMKVLNKAHLIDRNQVAHTRDEKSILQRLQHPFIVKLRYAFQTKEKLYMIMDYVHGGELFYHLKIQGKFPEERVRFYAAEIASALFHLHAQNIVYRDLKPENLLLDSDGHIVITDFGLSKIVGQDERTQTFCGTPEYLAPEVLRNEGHNQKVDWWSLGTLIYEMLSGLPPFYSKNIHEMYQRILSSKLVFPTSFSQDAQSLLMGLLNRNPDERFGSEQVKNHPFFAKIDWEKLERKEITPPWRPPNAMNIDAELYSVEVNDSYNGGRPNLTIDEEDADAFDGFTYVGGMNTTSPRNAIKTTPKAEETKKEEVKAEVVVVETKHEEVKVEEPKADPALQIKIEGNNNDNTEDKKPAEEKHISPKVEIVAEELLSPKSVTSEEDDESESSDEDSESSDSEQESNEESSDSEQESNEESSDSEYESKEESSSDDNTNRGPFIVRLPGQQ